MVGVYTFLRVPEVLCQDACVLRPNRELNAYEISAKPHISISYASVGGTRCLAGCLIGHN